MQTLKTIVMKNCLIVISLLFILLSCKEKVRFNAFFYGMGEPLDVYAGDVVGNIHVGPVRYELHFYDDQDGEYVSLEGQELELTDKNGGGWFIAENIIINDDGVNIERELPIFWKGSYRTTKVEEKVKVSGELNSGTGSPDIELDLEIPFSLVGEIGHLPKNEILCFDVAIANQTIKFCNSEKHFIDNMVELYDKTYKKSMSESRKNIIYNQ